MEKDFNLLTSLWKNYNNASSLLTKAMGGTHNEVGEFAEKLVAKYYQAEQLTASNKSADLKTLDEKLIQVKSRKIKKIKATSLNVIRSWDFDILVVVLFSKDGNILKGLEISAKDAQQISKPNGLQNGDILITNKNLLNHLNAIDITDELQSLIDGQTIAKLEKQKQMFVSNKRQIEENDNSKSKTKLNIEFIPNDERLFKQEILRTKRANRTWYYSDGRIIKDIWNASKFTIESSLRGNINTNNKVKQRKETGLTKLKIEIIE